MILKTWSQDQPHLQKGSLLVWASLENRRSLVLQEVAHDIPEICMHDS